MQPHQNPFQNVIKFLFGLVVLGLAGFAFWRLQTMEDLPKTGDNDDSVRPSSNNDTVVENINTKYKDGTYTTTGYYSSPAGQDNIVISLTLKNDTVVGASFVGHANNPGSFKYQAMFKEGFDDYAIGKNVDDLKLEVISGASLTPRGFMEALEKIKKEALS